MSTEIKPELSKKNLYWIPKHRYYELKHFCMQYEYWKHEVNTLRSRYLSSTSEFHESSYKQSPVENIIEQIDIFERKISIIEKAAVKTDPILAIYILKGVTQNYTYDKLNANTQIPCCRDIYYEMYRKFFWILNNLRD